MSYLAEEPSNFIELTNATLSLDCHLTKSEVSLNAEKKRRIMRGNSKMDLRHRTQQKIELSGVSFRVLSVIAAPRFNDGETIRGRTEDQPALLLTSILPWYGVVGNPRNEARWSREYSQERA